MVCDVLICNARLLGSQEPGWVTITEGTVTGLGSGDPPSTIVGETIDAGGHLLAPGLIDLHVHGALGRDTMDATPNALGTMARFYAEHGVTGFLATTMSAPAHRIGAALENVAVVMRQGTGGAALLGAHVEGPCINAAKRGCQAAANIRPADPHEYDAWFESGAVRLITVAPEIPENETLIRDSGAQGVRVAAGHTMATYDQMVRAVGMGITQVTHVYNAMSPLHHREPGAVGAALTLPELYVQLIADGVHVHPAMLDLAIRTKGVDRTILVTDAMAGAGMPDGDYDLGDVPVSVRDGNAREPGGALAGSTLTLERAVATIMSATGMPLEQVWRMGSAVPAAAMGWPRKGRLAVGCDADLALLDDDLTVQMTIVAGQIVYSR